VAEPSAATPAATPRRRRTFWQWVRHHATALLSTGVDYAVMVICVELVHLRPVLATVIGAACGAVTNFLINRSFTYHVGEGHVREQAWKFVLVSGASLGLNALGEYTFHDVVGLQYMLARVITSVVVSNGWNYPMLRFFVFSRRQS
jgi:putative flippase GtrA